MYDHDDTNGKNICVLNFRGGDMVGNAGAFVPRSYWENAMEHMSQYNPNMEYCIVTDDVILRIFLIFLHTMLTLHDAMSLSRMQGTLSVPPLLSPASPLDIKKSRDVYCT